MKTPAYKLFLIVGALAVGGCVEPYGYTQTTYRTGYELNTLPPGHRTVNIDGTRYYTHNDTYFRPRGNSYVVVDSPRRDRRGYDTRRDYRDGGEFRDRAGYQDPRGYDRRGQTRYQSGTVVRTLPEGYRRIDRRGTTYYQYNDTYFQPHSNGYVVVDYR